VFASRSPARPNGIGLTVVELRRKDGNRLHVHGLDMLDGTPILDIKPYLSSVPEEKLRRGWLAEAQKEKRVMPMVSLTALIFPILVSAVFVFVASFLIHMVLGYHKSDLRKLPDRQEDELLEAVRRLNLPTGDYGVPHPGSPQAMKDPAFIAKMKRGPLVLMTVAPGAPPSMGKNLAQWFVLIIVITVFAAYIASRAVAAGADYLRVFRFVGASAFMGYSLSTINESIWYRRSWARTWKTVFDGLVYALLTAGVFGWLWPRG
jgi:hypothetical protein